MSLACCNFMFCHCNCFGSRKRTCNYYCLNDDLSLAGISLKARKWQISQAERKVKFISQIKWKHQVEEDLSLAKLLICTCWTILLAISFCFDVCLFTFVTSQNNNFITAFNSAGWLHKRNTTLCQAKYPCIPNVSWLGNWKALRCEIYSKNAF